MSCNNKSFTRLVPVYTKASKDDKVFFAATPVLSTADIDTARVSFEIINTEGNVAVERAYRESDDGITWSAPTAFGPGAVSAAGWSYGVFGTLSNLKTFMEIGVLVNSASVQYGEVNVQTSVRLG